MNTAIAHHYHIIRKRSPHYTAEQALASARSHLHFMRRLDADITAHTRRSRAARKGWKTRRAQQRML